MNNHNTLDELYDKILLISKHMLRSLEKEADQLGYNRTEYLIISDIIEHQETTAQAISQRTGIKKSALSRSLNPLIEKDIVSKKQCSEDRRESKLMVDNQLILEQFCKARLLSQIFSSCPKSKNDITDIDHHLSKLIDMMSQE